MFNLFVPFHMPHGKTWMSNGFWLVSCWVKSLVTIVVLWTILREIFIYLFTVTTNNLQHLMPTTSFWEQCVFHWRFLQVLISFSLPSHDKFVRCTCPSPCPKCWSVITSTCLKYNIRFQFNWRNTNKLFPKFSFRDEQFFFLGYLESAFIFIRC